MQRQRVLVVNSQNYHLQMVHAALFARAIEREVLRDPNFIMVHDEIVHIDSFEFERNPMQDKAYKQGKEDAQIYGLIPTAAMVTKLTGITDDEAVVCYMNGVGDALAGL